MTDVDKPKAHLSFKALDAEEKPEPFTYTNHESKRVVFPDVFDWGYEEGEEFLEEMRVLPARKFLTKWLTEEDFAKLQADKLSVRQMMRVTQAAMNHYESTLGDSGEENASES